MDNACGSVAQLWPEEWTRPAASPTWLVHAISGCGIGAQVQARLSLMLFAAHCGLHYVHRPLSRVDQSPPGYAGNWSADWEAFFRLGEGVTPLSSLGRQLPLHLLDISTFPSTAWRPGELYLLHNAHLFADRAPGLYAALMPEMRRRYFLNPKPELTLFRPGALSVAVHVRRGDTVDADGGAIEPDRYEATHDVVRRVETVRQVLAAQGRPVEVHVFTDGDPAGFSPFAERGYRVHEATCAFSAFHHMVEAEVLFTARSSFSYTAALYRNRGAVIYDPFWHVAQPDWITLNGDTTGLDARLKECFR